VVLDIARHGADGPVTTSEIALRQNIWPHIAIAIGTLTALFFKVDLLWVVHAGGTISAFGL